jgi:spermidine synthase
MKKAHVLQEVKTPDGSTQALVERDGHYMIWVNGRELMSTRHAHSEEQLGVVGCSDLTGTRGAQVLVGGLGLGFTLRAALNSLAPDARVVVAELMPEVVAWNRQAEYPLAHRELSDPRTEVVVGDVERVIAQNAGRFDAILLDADNETTAMNTRGNSRLYGSAGVESVARALSPRGKVVYWSVGEDPALVACLRRARFAVETHRVRKYAGATSGGYHFLIAGRKEARGQ